MIWVRPIFHRFRNKKHNMNMAQLTRQQFMEQTKTLIVSPYCSTDERLEILALLPYASDDELQAMIQALSQRRDVMATALDSLTQLRYAIRQVVATMTVTNKIGEHPLIGLPHDIVIGVLQKYIVEYLR